MGYVFDFNDAVAYDQWLNKDGNQRIVDLENRLMVEMLHPRFGERLLDIGCGAGASLMPFIGKGIQLTGVDPSPYMLDIAKKKVGHRVDLHRAFAEDLPFEDNSFDYAALCLSLEFADDPRKALEEACRVAKDGVFVGALNKYALKAFQRRIRGIFKTTIYNRARFFSIGEIKYLFTSLLGDVPISWQTTCHFPGMTNSLIDRFENSGFARKSPFGAFAGILALPVPRFRTHPLKLKSASAQVVASTSRPVNCAEKKVEGR
ncbi:MAG: class I SAM-dependent methyltransferase [Desulfobacteraceae bacterium]|nr:class I SAM-dependent methyltransferase [Desulfobacteraceae bacterium]MBC2756066.1 class I SAM-dependent methyltransferase [Desulfobacteraceae bacterium]